MVAKYHQRLFPIFGLMAVLLLSPSMPAMGAPGDTELISLAPGYSSAQPAISPDGRYVVFATSGYQTAGGSIQLHDRLTETTDRVDHGLDGQASNGSSRDPDLSADGRFVTFTSTASNLVPGDTDGTISDVFVRDMQSGSTVQVSIGMPGQEENSYTGGPRISADGRFVAFWYLVWGETEDVGIFMWDRQTRVITRISVGYDGQPVDLFILWLGMSEDGRYVAFSSADGIIFVRDCWLGITEPVSPPNGSSAKPEISADGRFVVFTTYASDLVPGTQPFKQDQNQIVLHDRTTGLDEWAALSSAGALANIISDSPDVSADGRFVLFLSYADNLIPGDTNEGADLFLRDRLTGSTQLIFGAQSAARISADGRFAVFATPAKLSPLDTDNGIDVYVHEIAVSEPGPSSYALTPQTMSFGTQTTATSRTQDFWLRNTGTTALPMGGVTLTGTNPTVFSLAHSCGVSIAVGAGCAIKVTFRPTWVGNMSALVKVVVGDNLTTTRPVSGTGVRARDTVLPTSLSFGTMGINTTSAGKYVTVTNTGAGVLPIKSIYLSGPNARQFVRTHNCPAYVPVGGSCTVRVYFKPWAVGAKTATLTVWAGGYVGPKTVALSGTGTTTAQ